MEFTAQQVAQLINGEVVGDAQQKINSVCKIDEGQLGGLAFLSNPKYTDFLYSTKASVVIVNDDFQATAAHTCTLIRVADAYQAFTKLLAFYQAHKPQKTGREEPCFVHKTAKLGKDVYVGAFAYIGAHVVLENGVKIYPHVYIDENSHIGENTVVFSGAKIYHDTQIGKNCVIHSGAVIGADGFGFAPDEKGVFQKIPQIGKAILEDFVEIGANSTIDRATMGETRIMQGTKIDNLVQIAHNVVIGKHTVIAAQSGVAGSTKIGDHCMFGGQVGVAGHLHIADGTKIAAQSGISKSIKQKNSILQGSPALPHLVYNKAYAYFKQLPEIDARLHYIEQSTKKNGETKDIKK
jgi:UDP-3-O-[3-hydroxymyristoyl] glucosamine N-acyltransferase